MTTQKKILFIIPTVEQGGGAERVCAGIAHHFLEQGHHVAIQTLRALNGKTHYPLDSAIRIFEPPFFALGIYPAALHSILKWEISGFHPDIIISFLWWANTFASVISRFTRIPAIISERANPVFEPPDPKSLCRCLSAIPNLYKMVAQTNDCANYLKHFLHLRSEQIVVIPNPLSEKPPINGAFDFQSPYLLAVGRLTYQKGYDRMLRIFSAIHQRYSTIHLLICGDGPDKKILLQQCNDLKISSFVHFIGHSENLTALYQNACVTLMTSHYEGLPNVILESMHWGNCPVISFDCDFGPRDIISHGIDGLLIPQDREDLFIAALAEYLQTPEIRERFKTNMSNHLSKFNPERVYRQWDSLLLDYFGNKGK